MSSMVHVICIKGATVAETQVQIFLSCWWFSCRFCSVLLLEGKIPQLDQILFYVCMFSPVCSPQQVRWIKDSKLPINKNISVQRSVLSLSLRWKPISECYSSKCMLGNCPVTMNRNNKVNKIKVWSLWMKGYNYF